MSETVQVDVPFKPPESIFTLCNDVLQHGVIYLLVPPQELLTKWMQEDGVYADDEEKRDSFLKNFQFDIELLSEDDDVREQSCELLEDEKAKDIMPFLQMFIMSLQERVVMTVLERLMPLYVMSEDEGTLSTSNESIADSIARLQPLNKSAAISPQISEVITELLESIKSDIESENGKKVFEVLTENDDEEDDEFDVVKDDLTTKHGYDQMAVRTAHDKLLPIFVDKLDGIMEEVCEYLRERIFNRVEEMFLEDRENLPGPQHME